MNEKLKQLKCELCGQERFLLINVQVASDSWVGGKGVCFTCFKLADLDNRIFLKAESFINEQIESIIERKTYWENLRQELLDNQEKNADKN